MNLQPEPDTKDWTWVLREPCPECGFEASAPARSDLAALTAEVGRRWEEVLPSVADPRSRPAPTVWSPLEYTCHVRDVFALATFRVGLMRTEDAPQFANWDQDVTAIEDDYASQDPDAVTAQVGQTAGEFAATVASVGDHEWERSGLRGDGAEFTVESFVRYLLHDPIHHLTDVTGQRWS